MQINRFPLPKQIVVKVIWMPVCNVNAICSFSQHKYLLNEQKENTKQLWMELWRRDLKIVNSSILEILNLLRNFNNIDIYNLNELYLTCWLFCYNDSDIFLLHFCKILVRIFFTWSLNIFAVDSKKCDFPCFSILWINY